MTDDELARVDDVVRKLSEELEKFNLPEHTMKDWLQTIKRIGDQKMYNITILNIPMLAASIYYYNMTGINYTNPSNVNSDTMKHAISSFSLANIKVPQTVAVANYKAEIIRYSTLIASLNQFYN